MKHEMKEIPGYQGRYWVSEHGRVWSAYSMKFLTPVEHRDGYLKVRLCLRGVETECLIHRLVAVAFVPNPDGKPEVNHLDADKKNNTADNLEWATRSENMKHAAAAGVLAPVDNRGEKNGQAKLTTDQVLQIRAMRGAQTQTHLAEVFGVSRRTIGMIFSGARWPHV